MARRNYFISRKRLLRLRLSKIPEPIGRLRFFNNFRANLPYDYLYGKRLSYDKSRLRCDVDAAVVSPGSATRK